MESVGCSRLSAELAAYETSEGYKRKSETYKKLAEWIKDNPPPKEVEELIWSFCISNRGSYYS